MKIQLLFASLLIAAALSSCNGGDDPAGPVKVKSITLNATSESLVPEGTFQLSVTEVLPSNAADQTVTWSSSPTTVATVDQTGLVTVLATAADGATATITATANDGSGKTASCAITVAFVKVTGIALNETAKSLAPEGTFQLSVTEVLPSDATDQTVTWSSSPTTVATVDQTGLVTVLAGAADGATATITATANDGSGKTASCAITVQWIRVTGITLDRTAISLVAGGYRPLTVLTLQPDNATNKNVTWSSSNTSVATVNSNTGVVTIAAGASYGQTAIITATSTDGSNKTATCTVTIRFSPSEGVLINGLVWATRNVDTRFTFAATPEATGMFYQWNRYNAWATTGTVTGWNSSDELGDIWYRGEDPSPSNDWHVPTKAEQATLLDASKVTGEWTTRNGVKGYKFTDKANPNNSIFLPAVGLRDCNGGPLRFAGDEGYYWSNAAGSERHLSWGLRFGIGNNASQYQTDRANGFSVRPVYK